MRVGLEGDLDPAFEALLRQGVELTGEPPLDIVFLRVDEPADLERLFELRSRLRPAGAIWVLREKGPRRRVTEGDVIAAGRRHGLVDNKIASFSDELSAMRLVIPTALRPGHSESEKSRR